MKPDRDSEFEDEFMKELKSAISDRNATLDEVIAMIGRLVPQEGLGMHSYLPASLIIKKIAALKTPVQS